MDTPPVAPASPARAQGAGHGARRFTAWHENGKPDICALRSFAMDEIIDAPAHAHSPALRLDQYRALYVVVIFSCTSTLAWVMLLNACLVTRCTYDFW